METEKKALISEDFFPEGIKIDESKIFPVVVMAGMSNGKSTLINALLGKEMLPTSWGNTEKFFYILSDDQLSKEIVCVTDKKGRIKVIEKNIEESLKKINKDSKVSDVFIRSRVDGILNTDKALLLIDTPSMYTLDYVSNEEKLYKIFDKINGGIFLYVINRMQVACNDEKKLLEKLKEIVDKKKTIKILFVVNKMDQCRDEEEQIENGLISVKKYLELLGFKKPDVVPFSAKMALLFKNALSKRKINRYEEEDVKFGYHLYAPRDFSMRKYVISKDLDLPYEKINISREIIGINSLKQALDNTGIGLIEEYIQKAQILSGERVKNTIKVKTTVNGINMRNFSIAHIIPYNPIVNDTVETKKEYLRRLNKYLRIVECDRKKYEKAELNAYQKIIMSESKIEEQHDMEYYKYFILLDFIHIQAYDFKIADTEKIEDLKKKYFDDFFEEQNDNIIAHEIFDIPRDSKEKLKQLLDVESLKTEREYLKRMYKNVCFKDKDPINIMITANMSAGKSTFINALIGKYICLSQNMACTSKIHRIVNKAFPDGYSTEYDHDLVLTAGKEELLNDNELNKSDEIIVSTDFIGELANQRIVVNDSPGVNYSRDEEHKKITDRLIEKGKYNLLIYVMNATQLATDDERVHLSYVKKMIGETPILFVINKMDTFNVDEEDFRATVKGQINFLKNIGFEKPMVCPVSAKAGYLAKKFMTDGLSKSEERELYNYVDKFNEMKLDVYYSEAFKNILVKDDENEEKQLIKTSGLAYVEKIIITLCEGENKNGSDIY